MQGDTFTAGVAPGGPATHFEVKILLLYALSSLEGSASFQLLHEALGEYDLINYFSLVEALDQLAETEQLAVSQTDGGIPAYSLTEAGRRAAGELASSLPISVRQKAASSMTLAAKRERRRAEVQITETRRGKGYQLALSIPDEGGDLLSLSVFAPTLEDRDRIRLRFLNDPVYIYQSILALLTGDAGLLEGAAPEQENLF